MKANRSAATALFLRKIAELLDNYDGILSSPKSVEHRHTTITMIYWAVDYTLYLLLLCSHIANVEILVVNALQVIVLFLSTEVDIIIFSMQPGSSRRRVSNVVTKHAHLTSTLQSIAFLEPNTRRRLGVNTTIKNFV